MRTIAEVELVHPRRFNPTDARGGSWSNEASGAEDDVVAGVLRVRDERAGYVDFGALFGAWTRLDGGSDAREDRDTPVGRTNELARFAGRWTVERDVGDRGGIRSIHPCLVETLVARFGANGGLNADAATEIRTLATRVDEEIARHVKTRSPGVQSRHPWYDFWDYGDAPPAPIPTPAEVRRVARMRVEPAPPRPAPPWIVARSVCADAAETSLDAFSAAERRFAGAGFRGPDDGARLVDSSTAGRLFAFDRELVRRRLAAARDALLRDAAPAPRE